MFQVGDVVRYTQYYKQWAAPALEDGEGDLVGLVISHKAGADGVYRPVVWWQSGKVEPVHSENIERFALLDGSVEEVIALHPDIQLVEG